MDQADAAGSFDRLAVHVMAEGAPVNPATGLPLPERLSDAVRAIEAACRAPAHVPGSLLSHIVEHCVDELGAILRAPRRKLARRYVLVPLHRVRQVDARGVMWLARQPGRSVRDKLAQSQRMLTLTGERSLDLRENRVVRDVAERVLSLLKPVLAVEGALTPRERQRLARLHDFKLLATEGLRAAGFADVPSERVTAPNNVLMADPLYRPIWQAHLWLRTYSSDMRRAAAERAERCAGLLFALLVAACRGADVVVQDRLVRRETGIAGTGFGVIGVAGGVRADIWRARAAGLDWLLVEQTGGMLRIEKRIMAGQKLARTRRAEDWAVSCAGGEIVISGSARPLAMPFAGDGEGLLAAARSLAALLLPELQPLDTEEAAPTPARHVALDPAAVIPRLVIDGAPRPPRVLAAAGVSAPEQVWVRATSRDPAPPDIAEWHSAPACIAALLRKDEESPAVSTALQRILRQLWAAHLAPDAAAELAVAVPGQMKEPARIELRRAIGPGFGKVWLIDRAPAASLGWQADPGFARAAVRHGDHLLVVDSEAGELHLSWLRAETAEGGAITWVRDLSAPRFPAGPSLTWAGWCRDFVARFVEDFPPETRATLGEAAGRMLESGDVERVLAGAAVPIVLPTQPVTVARFAPNETIAHAASGEWCRQYREWLQANAAAIQAALPVLAPGARWHVLHVGRPLDRAEVSAAVRIAWDRFVSTPKRRFVHYVPDPAGLVASGAAAFLARHPGPTWVDHLPELNLEVETDGQVQLRPILRSAAVAPGATIRIASPAPGERGYERLLAPVGEVQPLLPVVDRNGAVVFNARLRSPAFPLDEAAPIGLDVSYTHGESEIRLTVRSESAAQPFRDIQATLVNVVNRVPSWRRPERDAGLPRRLERLRQTLGRHPSEEDRSALGTLPPAGAEAAVVEAVGRAVWLPWLERHAARLPEIDLLGRALLRCLESAGVGVSPALIAALGARVPRYPGLGDVRLLTSAARWLGLCLRDAGAAEQTEVLLRLTTAFRTMRAYTTQVQPNGQPRMMLTRLNPVLEALRLSFYMTPDFLTLLPAQTVAGLVEDTRLLFERVGDWRLLEMNDESVPLDRRLSELEARFRTLGKACEMLVTLLQLRGIDEADPAARAIVEAGSARAHATARALRRLDLAFRAAAPAAWRPPASDLSAEDETPADRARMYPVTYTAYSLLAGYDAGRLLQGEADRDVD